MEYEQLTADLRKLAYACPESDWPKDAIDVLSRANCWGRSIAKIHGGTAVSPAGRVAGYEAASSGCMSASLVLTQHDGACELISSSDNESLKAELLPALASGENLATLGISQLTTSRKHSGSSMRAAVNGDGFVLNGVMPWVTSASRADHVVTGAVLEDDRQLLACIPLSSTGITIDPPINLMGLTASFTSEVKCDAVYVEPRWLLKGPAKKVLLRRSPVKSLTVSACGMGMAGALLDVFRERTATLPGSDSLFDDVIQKRFEATHKRLYQAADQLNDPEAEVPAMEIRVAVNDLVARLAVSLMTLIKGSGYVSTHPHQRLIREALFFQIWSAPQSVQLGTIEHLWVS